MTRNISYVFLALALSGCMSDTVPCPAFGSPLADSWSTVQSVGDVANFVSDTGATVALELRSRRDSPAYEGIDNNGSGRVNCNVQSTRLIAFDNTDIALKLSLQQSSSEDPVLQARELFSINVIPQSLSGDGLTKGYVFGFSLSAANRAQYTSTFTEDNVNDVIGSESIRSIENLQIGNNQYPYAVERKLNEPERLSNAVTHPSPFATITRMIMAEDGGLVQFELLNGEIYSRL